MRDETLFELLPLNLEAPPGSPRAPLGSPSRPIVLPTLTIRDQPFVVLERFAHKVPTMPAAHGPIVERIARLVVASRVSAQPIGTIRLVGHTDSTGPAAFNLGLGTQRAQSVETALRAAIAALGAAVPAGSLNIVVQTLGETRPIASNATTDGRARNRRVAVFLATTCHSFFAQYDLRFLPGDPVFGIPAYPNLSAAQKAQRSADVGAMVPELLARRNQRAAAALAGSVPPLRPLPLGPLRSRALRLSDAQLALYREYFPDGRGGIEFGALRNCFARFANGQLRSPLSADQTKGVGEPNGGFFFLFAEFAFLCIASRIQAALWTQALRHFVMAQEIFMHVYRPAPLRPAPAVGAAPPACPRDPLGRARARRGLDSFSNANFRAIGGSPVRGRGQSAPTRIRALAARYATANLAALQGHARTNMQRAQCMP